MTHELKRERGAWLQIPASTLSFNGNSLTTGDGANIEEPGTLTLLATWQTKTILFVRKKQNNQPSSL